MTAAKPPSRLDHVLEQAARDRAQRERSYRERALRVLPHLCARCGREFAGERLKELTVHHKDHDHDHNPADGSNWELLCLYCHDAEHRRGLDSAAAAPGRESQASSATYTPMADLATLLTERNDGSHPADEGLPGRKRR
jgi:HNH endonuclease